MHMGVLCTACMPGALGGQKRASDPVGLDFQMVRAAMCVLGITSECL